MGAIHPSGAVKLTLSILQEVQAYIEDKCEYWRPRSSFYARFDKRLTALKGRRHKNFLKHRDFSLQFGVIKIFLLHLSVNKFG